MEDPITPIEAILQRCPQQQMCLQYSITSYKNINEFLALVSRKLGKLSKGGVPNLDMAARVILNDWNSGKIKYYTHPPETETAETHVSSEIVKTFAKEFSLETIDKMDQEDLEDLPAVLPSETMNLEPSNIVEKMSQEDDEDDENDENMEDSDDDQENIGQLPKRMTMTVKDAKTRAKAETDVPKFKAEGLVKMKKASKIREKKERKERRRRDKVATELSNDLENAFETLGKGENDKYDFDKDFEM